MAEDNEFRWVERDRYGNEIYLTRERWEHITQPANHPEMEAFEDELRETIRLGTRKQESLDPQKYRYSRAFTDLTASNTHIVAVVLLKLRSDLTPNNFVVTAYQKRIW